MFVSRNALTHAGPAILLAVLLAVTAAGCRARIQEGPAESIVDIVASEYERLAGEAEPAESEVDNLLMFYCIRYLRGGGEAMSDLEAFLLERCSPGAAVFGFAGLTSFGNDSEFAAQLRAGAVPTDDDQAAVLRHADLLAETKRIADRGPLDAAAARDFVGLMEEARTLRYTTAYIRLLAEAYELLGMEREHFELGAYIHLSRGKEALYAERDLRRLYRKMPEPKDTLDEEMAAAGSRVKADMDRWGPDVPDYAFQAGDFVIAGSGEVLRLDFDDPASPVFRRPMVLAVFSTSCGYCAEEMEALSRAAEDLDGAVAVFGLEQPGRTGGAGDDALLSFGRANHVDFPLLTDPESAIFEDLEINGVPRLYFFDENGRLTADLRFRSMANLELKIGWYLDDLRRQ